MLLGLWQAMWREVPVLGGAFLRRPSAPSAVPDSWPPLVVSIRNGSASSHRNRSQRGYRSGLYLPNYMAAVSSLWR